jgi:hypothetical protein
MCLMVNVILSIDRTKYIFVFIGLDLTSFCNEMKFCSVDKCLLYVFIQCLKSNVQLNCMKKSHLFFFPHLCQKTLIFAPYYFYAKKKDLLDNPFLFWNEIYLNKLKNKTKNNSTYCFTLIPVVSELFNNPPYKRCSEESAPCHDCALGIFYILLILKRDLRQINKKTQFHSNL